MQSKPAARPLWAAGLLLAAFAAWSWYVLTGRAAGIESGIYAWSISFMSPSLNTAMAWLTRLCDPLSIILLCVLLLLHPRTRPTVAVPVSAAAAASVALNLILKHAIARERPDILRLVTETSPSYPSAHAMLAATLCTMLALRTVPRLRSRPGRAALCALWIILALVIGLSRVYLGVHHAGDVLGGWLLGAAVSLVTHTLWDQYGTLLLRRLFRR